MTTLQARLANLSPEKLRSMMKALRPSSAAAAVTIDPAPRDGNVFPQSFSQQRQWFLEQLLPGAVYNVPLALEVAGPLDAAVLTRCLEALRDRHEILRTRFTMVKGVPSQVVEAGPRVLLSQHDLQALAPDARDARAHELMAAEARRPFDIQDGPLWRCALIRLAPERHLFLVTMHHIIADGWSFGVAIKELAALYVAFAAGAPSPLPPLKVQYADYAVWQRQWLEGERVERQLAYWREKLRGLPPLLRLPYDRRRPATQSIKGAVEEFEIPAATLAALRRVADQGGATLYMAMTSALAIVLARYAGTTDIPIGSPVANRVAPELERLIGLFINTLVIRCDVSGDVDFATVLGRVRATTTEAYANQDVPFERLVDELGLERSLSHSPLFQVLFVQVEDQLKDVRIPPLEVSPVPVYTGAAQFDLSVYLGVGSQGAGGSLEYNTDLFDARSIQELLRDLGRVLERIAEDPTVSVAALHADIGPKTLRVRVGSTFTAQPIGDALVYWLDALDLPARVEFAPYGQVFQELIEPESGLRKNREGFNVLLVRLEDWAQGHADPRRAMRLLERNVEEFAVALAQAARHLPAPLVVCLGPPSDAWLADGGRAAELARLAARLTERIRGLPNVSVLRDEDVQAQCAVGRVNAPQADEAGHIPYTDEYFAALGTAIVRAMVLPSEDRGRSRGQGVDARANANPDQEDVAA